MVRPVAVLVCFTLLAACTRLGTSGPAAALHPWTIPDTVRIGLYEEPDTLDPVIGTMVFASDIFQLDFDGLIRFDDRGRAVPDLARELPTRANGGISRDGTIITYHLMPGAAWSDGVPLTSKDVLFTWRAIMNPDNDVSTRVGYDQIERIETPDAHTVRLVLKRVYPPALFLFRDGIQGAIVPEHLLGREHDLNRVPFNGRPIGSGPYVLRTWEHGSQMIFDANPHYFRGAPKIRHVIVKFVPSQDTLASQLRTHEIDAYINASIQQVQRLRTFPDIAVRSASTIDWEHLSFDVRHPPLDERAVRIALVTGFDSGALFAKIYHGLGSNAPVHFNPAFGWGDPTLHPYRFDPARAGALLDAAGWKPGPDGVRVKNGRRLAFTLSTVAGVKQREAIEVVLQAAWRAIGAEATVKNYPAALFFAPKSAGGILRNGETDASIFGWFPNSPDPDDTQYVNSAQMPPDGDNMSFYDNPLVDRLEADGLNTYDAAERRAAYRRIADVLYAEVPEYVLNFTPSIIAFNDDLRGVTPVPIGSQLWNVANWSF